MSGTSDLNNELSQENYNYVMSHPTQLRAAPKRNILQKAVSKVIDPLEATANGIAGYFRNFR